MKIQSTSDVSLDLLAEIASALPAELRGEVDERQSFFKSIEPPSWVAFVAALPWWLQALGAYGAFFAAEVSKEAAKDAWRNRRALVGMVGRMPRLLASPLVQAFTRLRSQVGPRTNVQLGLPFPDDHFGTRLRIEGSTAAEFATDLSLFLYHLPALADLLKSEALDEHAVVGQISLRLTDTSDLEVSWMDRTSLEVVSRRLPLPDAV